MLQTVTPPTTTTTTKKEAKTVNRSAWMPLPPKNMQFFCAVSEPPNSNKGPKKGYHKPLCTNPPHKKSLEKFVAFSPHNKHSQYFKRISRFPFGAVVGLCSVNWRWHRVFVFSCAIASVQGLIFPVTWTLHREVQQGETVNHKGKKKRHSLPVPLVPQYYSCVSVVFSWVSVNLECMLSVVSLTAAC